MTSKQICLIGQSIHFSNATSIAILLTYLLTTILHTLVYRIDVQDEINVQVGKFLKNIKRAGQNRRAGGIFFSKSINVQTKIRPCRGEFFSQKHSQNTPNGNNKKKIQSTSEVFPNHSQKHSQNTTKPLPNRTE